MKSISELLAEYETRLLKDKLLEFPGKIRRIKGNLAIERQRLAEAQVSRNEEEALLRTMIAAEMNPDTGKPAYSNSEARAAELINRKKTSAAYQDAERVAQDAETAVNSLQFNLERLQDEFRAYRYVADLTARELALMASDCLSGEKDGSGNGRGVSRQPY